MKSGKQGHMGTTPFHSWTPARWFLTRPQKERGGRRKDVECRLWGGSGKTNGMNRWTGTGESEEQGDGSHA